MSRLHKHPLYAKTQGPQMGPSQGSGPSAPTTSGTHMGASQLEVMASGKGVNPSWKWVAPPGIGDAPQMVYTAFQLAPWSIDGAGDRPAAYLKSYQPPVVANFAMRWQGMPVGGGSVLLTGLYTPTPMASPTSGIFT